MNERFYLAFRGNYIFFASVFLDTHTGCECIDGILEWVISRWHFPLFFPLEFFSFLFFLDAFLVLYIPIDYKLWKIIKPAAGAVALFWVSLSLDGRREVFRVH